MGVCCWTLLTAAWLALAAITAADVPPPCYSDVYCKGDLLKTVQLASPNIYHDSKTFVDMKQKQSYNVTLERFQELMNLTGSQPTREEIQRFVEDNFEEGNELEEVQPLDWEVSPRLLSRISDPELRQWAQDLNRMWKNLTRRVNIDVKLNSDRYSLLYVPHPFVIPGGRFKELYYWDTYWIIRGLLLCDMNTTVKGIIENFLYLLDNYGIVPNGGRVYYLQRSQPPLLTPMVANYYVSTNDLEFVRTNIHLLEKEFKFWMHNRTVQVTKDGNTYTMARYYSVSTGPRPESYREDVKTSMMFSSEERRQELYVDIKSAAESGWDFSSRWFNKHGSNDGNLTDIDTRNIIPVDLNAFVFWNAEILSELFRALNDTAKSRQYAQVAKEWKEAVTAVLWDKAQGSWFDYDIRNNISRKYFYPSNFAPLWTGCYNKSEADSIANNVVDYINRNDMALTALGGIPTSLSNQTHEQWDWPNAWPPLQSIVIQGLVKTGNARAEDLAYQLAEKWVRSNFEGYTTTGEMLEKYDAQTPGISGEGGEYITQTGFGWTNGVVMELLSHYGQKLTAKDVLSVKKQDLSLLEILSPYSASVELSESRPSVG